MFSIFKSLQIQEKMSRIKEKGLKQPEVIALRGFQQSSYFAKIPLLVDEDFSFSKRSSSQSQVDLNLYQISDLQRLHNWFYSKMSLRCTISMSKIVFCLSTDFCALAKVWVFPGALITRISTDRQTMLVYFAWLTKRPGSHQSQLTISTLLELGTHE